MITHYFEEFLRIKVAKGGYRTTTEILILCGAAAGEAVNRRREVTCDSCLEKLKSLEGQQGD